MTSKIPLPLKTGCTDSRFTFTDRYAKICGTGPLTDHFHFHRPYEDYSFYNPPPQLRLVMSEKTTVHIEDSSDRWRYVCPRGHRTWEPTNHHFWCQSCARADGVDGVFHELRDRKTDETHERDEIRLVTPTGPYDRDLDRRKSA